MFQYQYFMGPMASAWKSWEQYSSSSSVSNLCSKNVTQELGKNSKTRWTNVNKKKNGRVNDSFTKNSTQGFTSLKRPRRFSCLCSWSTPKSFDGDSRICKLLGFTRIHCYTRPRHSDKCNLVQWKDMVLLREELKLEEFPMGQGKPLNPVKPKLNGHLQPKRTSVSILKGNGYYLQCVCSHSVCVCVCPTLSPLKLPFCGRRTVRDAVIESSAWAVHSTTPR